ncbi:MAG: cyclic nucleotide-binding domain-containing protein [Bacteroidota bacterium]|jgi:CRP/FNR family transcriptional regulator
MNDDYKIIKSSFWSNLFKTPTKKDQLEDILLSMAPFKNLDKKYFKVLVKIIHNRVYSPNEYVFMQKDPGIGLYLIIKGEILITYETEDGERYDLANLLSGDFFGELAILDEDRRSASAIAMKESQLAVIFKPDLDEFIDVYPKEGIKILRGISQIIATRLRIINMDYITLYNRIRNK